MKKSHLLWAPAGGMPALIVSIVVLGAALSDAAWIDRTDNGGIVTASSQIHERESKEMAFDNTTATKWLTYPDANGATGWIQFQFPNGQAFTIGRYSIASANDAPERDPQDWTLDGSNDGTTWTVVDTQINQFWTDRFQRREFICANPGAYNYYRLNITRNNGSSNLTGFSEMELLEDVYIAENPSPAMMADEVTYEGLVLSWDAPTELVNPTYQVYLSDSLLLVQNADPSVLVAQQSETSYPAETLDSFTTYYWRVDILDGDAGNLWQFRTQLPDVSCLGLLGDIDGDCEVTLPDLVILASQWLFESCPSDLCADLNDSSRVDMSDLAVVSQAWSQPAETIVLSEIMADNETTLADNFGDYSDWIEIRNLGDTPQTLQGWYLTDDDAVPDKWAFPDVTIGAKGFLIVFASGRNLTDDPSHLHLNFKLDKDGQYLALVRPDLTVAHAFRPGYPSLGNDEAYGLAVLPGEDRFVTSLLASPTPGKDNAAAVVWGQPEYSKASGIYPSAFQLELTPPDPGTQIRYTTDGSLPTATSALYCGPLTISHTTCLRAAACKDKYLPGKTATHTFLFPAEILHQPALPDGFPSLWKTTVADYEMDPDIVNDAAYGPLLEASLLSLPSISIVTDNENLFNANTGIYSNPLQEGVAWERPASVELITPDNSEAFQIDCGLRIQGGAFRSFDLTKKKSFRFVFKREYGKGKLEFPLFDYDETATDSFDTITLRAGANDGYSWDAAYLTEQYIRDEFGRSVQRDAGDAGSHGIYVHLYLNGLYWGLYNAVERPDNAFSATYYGGNKDDWDAINSGDVSEGNLTAWNLLLGKCRAGMTTLAAYEEIQGNNPDGSRNPAYPNLIDAANYIDYIIINMWGGNGDWPWRNYWIGRLRTEESTGFKFYCWDYEGTIASPFAQENKVSADFNSGVGVPHHYLKENAEYRMLFADRVHRLFFNDGVLTADAVVQRYSDLADRVESSIVAESARWGDMHHEPPLGLNEWIAKRDAILTNYLPARSGIVLDQMRDAGFYPQVNAPVFHINGSYQNGGHTEIDDLFSMVYPGTAYDEAALVSAGDAVRVHAATDNSLGLTWTMRNYVPDSSWSDGTTGTGVGYEKSSGYESLIHTDVSSQMYGIATSVFCRMAFNYDGIHPIEALLLEMKYDDGFIAYINGMEVCRGGTITSDVPGSASATDHEAGASYEQFDITASKNTLVVGTNILAIHGINKSTTSTDMLMLPQLIMKYTADNPAVPIWFTLDGSDPRLIGGAINPTAIQYTGAFPLKESSRIKARSLSNGQWSALNEAVYAVGPVAKALRITEIMYHPADDPNSEFIELMNIGTESINLNHVQLTNGVEFEFPSIDLSPAAALVVVRNTAAFSTRYPDFSGIAVGPYQGALDDGGERIRLVDAAGTVIHDFSYKDSWYDITDGGGFSLVIKNPAASDSALWDEKSGWRPSAVAGGSPGMDDSGLIPPIDSVIINEILAHSDAEAYDWIELYNTTDEPIHIGGWFLSDNNNDDPNRMKYQIADGTVIGDHGYKVFYENLHFGNLSDPGCHKPFQLSENGETLYLQSGSDGALTGYYQEEDFGASERDVAFGRYFKSTGASDFVAMSSNTPGAANAYPKVGPVVITEIMYHPAIHSDAEYVELQNISGSPVTLFDPETGTAWRFIDNHEDIGIDFHFPTDTPVTLAPNEKILLIKNLAAFISEYGSPDPALNVFEWLDGSLSNGGEKPEIQLPGDVDESLTRYYIRADRVSYDDAAPWPTEADGDGQSLTRISPTAYGNDAANWQAENPSPGL